jgi:hypothetical protein
MGAASALYERLIRDRESSNDLSPAERRNVAHNGVRQVTAQALQNIGDQIVNAKTVLPWLLSAAATPGWILALLVPIRESGSMLPQAALSPWVQQRKKRKWVWVAGASGQAVSAAVMALAAATTTGTVMGVIILVALTAFSLSRSLTSLTGNDVLGRTVPRGQRGQINGATTLLAGIVAVTIGLAVRLLGGDRVGIGVLAALLLGAACMWALAAFVFSTIREPVPEAATETTSEDNGWAARSWVLLRDDRPFRRFVLVRTLLLVSALSPPFVVALAAGLGGGLSGLGPFIIAQGLAGLIGGRFFGRLAERSSRNLLLIGAIASSSVILLFLALLQMQALRDSSLLYSGTYFLIALTHLGVRVARKTYIVDMGVGNQRTEYVAVANTALGVLLLVTGAISSALATLGNEAALLFLAGLGLLGVIIGRGLDEVTHVPANGDEDENGE